MKRKRGSVPPPPQLPAAAAIESTKVNADTHSAESVNSFIGKPWAAICAVRGYIHVYIHVHTHMYIHMLLMLLYILHIYIYTYMYRYIYMHMYLCMYA